MFRAINCALIVTRATQVRPLQTCLRHWFRILADRACHSLGIMECTLFRCDAAPAPSPSNSY